MVFGDTKRFVFSLPTPMISKLFVKGFESRHEVLRVGQMTLCRNSKCMQNLLYIIYHSCILIMSYNKL